MIAGLSLRSRSWHWLDPVIILLITAQVMLSPSFCAVASPPLRRGQPSAAHRMSGARRCGPSGYGCLFLPDGSTARARGPAGRSRARKPPSSPSPIASAGHATAHVVSHDIPGSRVLLMPSLPSPAVALRVQPHDAPAEPVASDQHLARVVAQAAPAGGEARVQDHASTVSVCKNARPM